MSKLVDNRAHFDRERIRWIAFDAVGTLIQPSPPVAAVYHQAAARHGSRLRADEVAARFRRTFASLQTDGALSCACPKAAEPWHTCEARERLRWRSIVDAVLDDIRSRDACFEELFAHFGQPASWKCFPDVAATLARLRRDGFRLAVSSNFDARLNSVMDGIAALAPIELRIISSLVGHRKPSARFFESLQAGAGCAPAEILFVGDDLQNDVEAAEAAGIPALQIDRDATDGDNRRLRSLSELVDLLRL